MKRAAAVLLCLLAGIGLWAGGGVKEPAKDSDVLIYGYLETVQTNGRGPAWVSLSQINPVISGPYRAGQNGTAFFYAGDLPDGIYRVVQWGYSYFVGRTQFINTLVTGLQGKDMTVTVKGPGLYYLGAYEADNAAVKPVKGVSEKDVLEDLVKAFDNYPTWKKRVQTRLETLK